ncbi:hypothetical protein EJB05_46468, partial [Eragrostis curvula]
MKLVHVLCKCEFDAATMGDRDKDTVWEHGEPRGAGFLCKYCKLERKGGGATRLKEHLAGRGSNVVHCMFVPKDVCDYYRRDIDRTKQKTKERQMDKMRAEEVARQGNVSTDEEDDELQAAMHASRQQHEYEMRSRAHGGQYDHGGGSSQGGGSKKSGGIMGMLKKSFSTREGGSSQPTYQPRIDSVMPSEKKKNARRAIGKAWAKWMHLEAIAGHKADSSYFSAAIKETQYWGEDVRSPTGREINGIYLDANEEDIKKQFAKFKLDWPNYGVTLMCDSWTGPTKMSIINFMVYSNGVMFFHKSVDATGNSQDADFIYKEMVKVLKELGPEHIVQIITDNGSNYKKAGKMISRKYPIRWQPCVAHTVNLMLKSIGEFPEHAAVIESARRISRWLYNHNQLHDMMKNAIGGELVRWCATRFGTNYMFLESMLRRREKFMAWVGSPGFLNSRYAKTSEGRYAHGCLSNLGWWDNMIHVCKAVEPLYAFLRFADQDKSPNLCEVLLKFHVMRNELESHFHNDRQEFERYMAVINPRMGDIANESYVNAACALHPKTHYAYAASGTLLADVRDAFEFMADTETCATALNEVEFFRRKLGDFSKDLARQMACDNKTSPAQWWAMFGRETPTLQRLAMRLVSQCCSSSGCERNWSTFALVHTKVRNRLTHQKLHKLVYVNYNLRIRLKEAGLYKPPEDDPFDKLMELTLLDESNPIRDWMEHGRSNGPPLLDEEATDSDTPIPSALVLQETEQLEGINIAESIVSWAEDTVGDTHIGKRKHQTTTKRKGKKQKRVDASVVASDASTDEDGNKSPPSAGDDSGNTTAAVHTSQPPPSPIRFTGETYFTHATQDQDHGAPTEKRTTMSGSGDTSRQHHHGYGSESSHSYDYRYYSLPDSSDTSSNYGHGGSHCSNDYYSYSIPEVNQQPREKWVFEWVEPEFYNMLLSQWQTNHAWNNQSWSEFRAHLLATQGIQVMSIDEYNAMNNPQSDVIWS